MSQGNSTGLEAQLTPEWLKSSLADGGHSGSASTWRTAPLANGQANPRWREENKGRWITDPDPASDRWVEGERWNGATGEGWRPREAGANNWRGPQQQDGSQRSEWRNERWGGAPREDTWRAPSGGPGYQRPGFQHGPGLVPAGGIVDGGFIPGRGRGRPSSSFQSRTVSGQGASGTLQTQWGSNGRPAYTYKAEDLARIYRHLLYTGRLHLPPGVPRDDPTLFPPEGEILDVVEQLMGPDQLEAAQAYIEHYTVLSRNFSRPLVVPSSIGIDGGIPVSSPPIPQSALLAPSHMDDFDDAPTPPRQNPQADTSADTWVYKDPQGFIQGPFSKQDIMEWFEGGFFPLDLQVKHALEPEHGPFRPLSDLLTLWRKRPPGFNQGVSSSPIEALPEDILPSVVESTAVPIANLSLHQQSPLIADPLVDPSLIIKRNSSSSLLVGALPQQQIGAPMYHQHQQQQVLGGQDPAFAFQQRNDMGFPAQASQLEALQGFLHHQQQQQQVGRHGNIGLGPIMQPQQQQQPLSPGHHTPFADLHQQQQQSPAWSGAGIPSLASITTAPTPAPSLVDIQKDEEAKALAEAASRQQIAQQAAPPSNVVPPPPPPPPHGKPRAVLEADQEVVRPETKPAPWIAAAANPVVKGQKSLVDIQREEEERAAKAAAESAKLAAAVAPHTGWAKVARGGISGGSLSLRDIQKQEALASHHAVDDEGLFWDYGEAQPQQLVQRPPPPPPPSTLPMPSKPAGAWAAAAASGASHAPVHHVALPPKASGAPARQVAPPPAPAGVRLPPPPPPIAPTAPAQQQSHLIDEGSSLISGPFRDWCREQMKTLQETDDVALCEFLMSVESNSEAAEYVTLYLGSSPSVAHFCAEFLKRKLEFLAGMGKKGKKKKSGSSVSSGTITTTATTTATATATATATTVNAQSGASTQLPSENEDWERVPKAAAKKKKGHKVNDPAILGFGSGTNYSLLEVPE